MKKINENAKITLTLGQLKKLVKEGTEPNFTSINDYELMLYAKLGWNYFNGMRSACDEIVAKINAKHDKQEWEKRANDFVAAVNAELGQELQEEAWINHPESFGVAELKRWNSLLLVLKDGEAAEEVKDAISRLAIPYHFVMVDSRLRQINNDAVLDIEFKRK